METITPVTIHFPNWFYGIISLTFIAFVFYLGGLHTELRNICKGFPKIQQALTRISEILLQEKMASELIYTQSPVRLTEKGQKALKEAGFDDFFQSNHKYISDKFKKLNPKNLADLEEDCKSYMLSLNEKAPKFENFRNYSYSNGKPIADILFAAAIALRDKLSQELNIKS